MTDEDHVPAHVLAAVAALVANALRQRDRRDREPAR